ncbi:MAG: hypothetical protein QMD09_13320, partial [Desulfatibacillaceae bacterium]|nr:hypothetical protein [Desulfatibacillaceae bacterium]
MPLPIHELPDDDFKTRLENICIEDTEELTAFAESIKKSLNYFFPEYAELVADIVDGNEAMYARAWAKN